MVVYAEYVIADNFVIDYLLIYLARKSLRLGTKARFLALSAALGAAVATVFPLLDINAGFLFMIKFFSGLFIVAASGRFGRVKDFVFCFYLFVFYTFLFGGAVIAVFYSLKIDIDVWTYSSEVPLGAALGVIAIVFFIVKRLITAFYSKRINGLFTRRCVIEIGGKTFSAVGFIDSGNRLVYRRTGSPVVVCGSGFSKKLTGSGALDKVRFEEMIFDTAAGKGKMKIFKAEKFMIYNGKKPNIIYSVMIGLPAGEIGDGEYDLLLGAIMA